MAEFLLKCLICSKDHSYSDISHLLTHISSKGHLAAQFKASVRGSQDPVLAQTLREYDHWFMENNVAQLLAQRMSKKDERKSGIKLPRSTSGRGRGGKRGKNLTGRHYKNRKVTISNDDTALITLPIDPSMIVKSEFDFDTKEYHQRDYEYKDETANHDPYTIEQLHLEQDKSQKLWQAAGFTQPEEFAEYQPHSYPWAAGVEDTYQDLTTRSPYTFETSKGSRFLIRHAKDDTAPVIWDEDVGNAEIEAKAENSRLKGIIWPGMNLFDAASPDGKRTRNQRKKHETISSLARLSEQVQPTEVIYYAETWDFKEDRIIDGEVHSPPPLGIPSPKKRQKRVALSAKSTNWKFTKRLHETGIGRGMSKRIKRYREDTHEDFKSDRPTTYTWTQSRPQSHRNTSCEPPRFDMFRDQYASRSDREHLPYPVTSGYNLLQDDQMTEQLDRSINQDRSSSHSYVTTQSMDQYQTGWRRPRLEAGVDTTSRPLRIQGSHDSSLRSYDHRLQHSSGSAHNRLEIPPLGTFGHPRSILHHQAIISRLNDRMVTSQDHYTDERNHGDNRAETHLRGPYTGRSLPRTQALAPRESDRYVESHTGIFEESSGDETIDQGIDSSPLCYRRRPINQATNQGRR